MSFLLQTKGKEFLGVFEMFDALNVDFDVFEKYKVNTLMASFALSVDKKYRGLAIGQRLMESR